MWKKAVCYIVLVAIGFGIGFVVPREEKSSEWVDESGNKLDLSKYKYINPTVMADIGKHYIINFQPLRDKLFEVQDRYPQKTYVYFLYLNNGSWIGLNERDNFTAASLAKVPLSMALYKAAEDKKIELTDRYTIEQLDLNSYFGELYKSAEGETYSIEELIEIMLSQSDNTALGALLRTFERIGINNPYDDVYQSFGWVLDLDQSVNANEINLKTLSNMFLALYNAKYINIENSEKVLKYLANTNFNDKIVAGLPEGAKVTHKIGVAGGNNTYSDCGIIYAPQRHYMLCVGSNGAGEQTASKFMAEVSKEVYDYVIKN